MNGYRGFWQYWLSGKSFDFQRQFGFTKLAEILARGQTDDRE